jgi:hypothetical protein
MAVAQGQTVRELEQCIEMYVDLDTVNTIGIPRLIMDSLGKTARLDLAAWIRTKYGERFKIHLLGTNPLWVKEVYYAAKYHPYIRSVDTSLPYNYAIAGEKVDDTNVVVKRPAGYFEKDWRPLLDLGLVTHNEQVMKSWLVEVGE